MIKKHQIKFRGMKVVKEVFVFKDKKNKNYDSKDPFTVERYLLKMFQEYLEFLKDENPEQYKQLVYDLALETLSTRIEEDLENGTLDLVTTLEKLVRS